MKVEFTHRFIKIFKRRIDPNVKLHLQFDNRVKLFTSDPANELLKDHKLTGKLEGYRAFSVTGDIRVIYYVYDKVAYFVDIGTHNQVYGA